jgi:hypothetical protein
VNKTSQGLAGVNTTANSSKLSVSDVNNTANASKLAVSGVNNTANASKPQSDPEQSRVQILLHNRVQKEMQDIDNEEKNRLAKEGSEKVIQQ